MALGCGKAATEAGMRPAIVKVIYARTFNLGDYNSARFEVALEAELDDDEDFETAQAELWDIAKASVKAQALPIVKRRNDEVEKIKASVPELQGA
jgi:hypothetical protein